MTYCHFIKALTVYIFSQCILTEHSFATEETKTEGGTSSLEEDISQVAVDASKSFSDQELREKLSSFLKYTNFSIEKMCDLLRKGKIKSFIDLIKYIEENSLSAKTSTTTSSSSSSSSSSSETSYSPDLDTFISLIKGFSPEEVLLILDVACADFLARKNRKRIKINDNNDNIQNHKNIKKLSMEFLKFSPNIIPLFAFIRLTKEDLMLSDDVNNYLNTVNNPAEYKKYFREKIISIFEKSGDDDKIELFERLFNRDTYQNIKEFFNAVATTEIANKLPQKKFYDLIQGQLTSFSKPSLKEKFLKESQDQFENLVITYATKYFSPEIFRWDEEKIEKIRWGSWNEESKNLPYLTIYYPGNVPVKDPKTASNTIKITAPPSHKHWGPEEVKKSFPGYNIFIPWNSDRPEVPLKGIIIMVYGGVGVTFPPLLSTNFQFLLNKGFVFVTLNLQDMNKGDWGINEKKPTHQLNMTKQFLKDSLLQIHDFIMAIKMNKFSSKEGLFSSEPENLKKINKSLKKLPIYLFGESFGGLVALNYSEHYSDDHDVNGVIVHDGLVSEKSAPEIHTVSRIFLDKDIDPSRYIKKLNVPILLLQNLDDRAISPDALIDFYEDLRRQDDRSVYLHLTRQGSPEETRSLYKGHFVTPFKKSLKKYRNALLNFMDIERNKNKKQQHFREEFRLDSDWQALRYKYVAARNIKGFSSFDRDQRYLGELFRIYKEKKHDKMNDPEVIEKEWGSIYLPTLRALYFAFEINPSELKGLIENKEYIHNLADYLNPYYGRFIIEEFGYHLSENGLKKLEESSETQIPSHISKIIKQYTKAFAKNSTVSIQDKSFANYRYQAWTELFFLSNPDLSSSIENDERFKKTAARIKEEFMEFIKKLSEFKQKRKPFTLREFFKGKKINKS